MEGIEKNQVKTQRLLLRRFKIEDATEIFRNWMSDQLVTQFLTFLPHENVATTETYVTGVLGRYTSSDNEQWVVENSKTGELMGSIGLTLRGRDWEVGYCFGKNYWGNGYGTEALRGALTYAFEEKKLARVQAVHVIENMASGRIMEKCGMRCEGLARSKCVDGHGLRQDAYSYAITADDYFGRCHMDFDKLTRLAQGVASGRVLSKTASCGSVGCAILTEKGNVYTGISIDVTCSLGFCAEHAAAAEMLKNGENHIKKIVAINSRGDIYPPCGRCREFVSQLCDDNMDAEFLAGKDQVVTLRELLPHDWRGGKYGHEPVTIDSERLKLLPIAERFAPDIFANFNEQVTAYMVPDGAKVLQDSMDYVTGAMERVAQGRELVFAITLKATGEFLGGCGIHNIKSGNPVLGIWTKQEAHGHGYGFEAISALIAYIRENLAYNHIVYPVDKRNYPSRRIPMLHGGKPVREYEVDKNGGQVLQIVEYHIG